jgi:hypothetical protein
MRTYLKQRLASDGLLATAYSLESVLIETVFILGPMLVALLTALASPAAAVFLAAACGTLGTVLFLRSPALAEWRVEARQRDGLLGPLAAPGFLPMVAVIVCYSSAFGLVEIGVTAYATEHGKAAWAGVLLGLMSLGSALGGIAYGSRPWHAPLAHQFALTLGVMAFGLSLLVLRWTPWAFALLSVLAGVVMAPALTIQSMLVARTAPPEQSTEAFTWSASALLSGVGIGFVVGGALLEQSGSSSVFVAASFAALLAALGAAIGLKR